MTALDTPTATDPAPPAPGASVPATHHRSRGVEVRPFPGARRLVIAAERSGRRMMPMHGLVQLDVTRARRRLAEHRPPLSMTAYVIACVARAAAAHPDVHAYRDWRGRIVFHRHVDVATIVEVPTSQGPFPMAHLVRDADVRSVEDITGELRSIKVTPTRSLSGRLLRRCQGALTATPAAVPLLSLTYSAMARSVRAHQVTGTVMVTSVGMFGGGGGFGIALPTLLSLQVLVGGAAPRPAVVDGGVEVRDLLDLTLTLDHNVVDGAPAARFGADLRRLVEGAGLLEES